MHIEIKRQTVDNDIEVGEYQWEQFEELSSMFVPQTGLAVQPSWAALYPGAVVKCIYMRVSGTVVWNLDDVERMPLEGIEQVIEADEIVQRIAQNVFGFSDMTFGVTFVYNDRPTS